MPTVLERGVPQEERQTEKSLRLPDWDVARIFLEVVRCGRPGTGMPYHDRDAYKESECYGGVTVTDLGNDMPQQAANFLRLRDIEIVVDYVLQHVKGKGAPTYQDCIDFFSEGARACDVYKSDAGAASSNHATAGR